MSDGRLSLPLETRIDENGNKYYIAKLKGPFVIDCSEKPDGAGGVVFLIFTSEAGNEELQISSISPPRKPKKELQVKT